MSARGMEIHNGSITFPEGSPPELHMGTEASPLTQGEAGQIVHSAVIDAGVLGGNVAASYNGVNVSADMTGNITTVEANSVVETDVALTGDLRGIETHVQMLGTTASISGFTIGIQIGMYSQAGCTHTGDVFGIFINNYQLGTRGGSYSFIRMEENGTMILTQAFFVGATDAQYFMTLRPGTCASGGWDVTTDVATSNGKVGILRIDTPVGDKAIQLYDIPGV